MSDRTDDGTTRDPSPAGPEGGRAGRDRELVALPALLPQWIGRLGDYDADRFGPLLGVSDEGSAGGAIAAAARASAKARALNTPDPSGVGVIIDGERMTSAGEVPIGPDEYREVLAAAFGRTHCTTNVGVRLNARLYQPLPEVRVPATAAEVAAAADRVFAIFKPFVETPDGRPRPLGVRLLAAPGAPAGVIGELVRAIEQGRAAGRLAGRAVHRLSLLVVFDDEIKEERDGGEIRRLLQVAAEAGLAEVAIDGELLEAARRRLSVPGLLNVLPARALHAILGEAARHGVRLTSRYALDPESAARTIWTGLHTARTQGLNGAKYGLVPLALEEQERVVELVCRWTAGWTAIPAFYVDAPLLTATDVYDDARCAEAAGLWMERVRRAGATVVLVDSPDRITPRRLLRDGPSPDDRGVLTLEEVAALSRKASGLGLKVLWSGGITPAHAHALGRLRVGGIFTTSSTARRIPVGPVIGGDPQLAAENEPTELGVRRVHALIQGGFLSAVLPPAAAELAARIEGGCRTLIGAIAAGTGIEDAVAALDPALVDGWLRHWGEGQAATSRPTEAPAVVRTMLSSPLADLAAESARSPFDCVVVGGGSAGLTAARTLAEAGCRVAVLEAGPAPFLTHISNTDLRYHRALSDDVRNQVQYSPKLPDGRPFGPNFGCLGGRGLFWNGAAPRFRRHDFAGWPFDASDLAAEYDWAEREFRVTTALGETRLAGDLARRLNAAGLGAVAAPFAVDRRPEGQGQLSGGIASGLGLFFRGAGAQVAAGRVRVATGVQARRVLIADGAATGVSASQGPDGPLQTVLGRSVILAGGCIESVRLAALSGVPDPTGRIGRGVQDHLFYRSYYEGPNLYDARGPEFAAVFIPSGSQAAEQWEIHAPGRRLFSLDDGSAWAPAPGDGYQFLVRSFAATEKRDANRVKARDGPLGSSVVHFSYSAADEGRMASIKERSAELARALGLRLVEERFAGPGGSYHEAGGLDMGADPATSVTDAEGRFHRVSNLLCVDAASWPRIGATNPHLTIVAVARRQARRLAARLAAPAARPAAAAPPVAAPVGPQSVRVFCGYRLPSLSREAFFKELGETFMPGTPAMLAPLGLGAYLAAALDLDPALGLPDEVALIVYASTEAYAAARRNSLEGRMYTHSHAGVFDMARSRGQFPGPDTAPDKLPQGDRWSWHLFDRPVDWQAGTTRVLFLRGPARAVQQPLLDATRGRKAALAAAGVDQAIAVAGPDYAALWLHAPGELAGDVSGLGVVPAGLTVLRDLTAAPVPMRTMAEAVTITGPAAFCFRFVRDLRFFL